MVWLFQTRHADSVSKPRSFRSATAARRSAQAGQAARLRTMQSRSPAMAQRLLRNTRTVHLLHSPRTTKTPPMRKPATGEPYAGEPHVRFGGRGGQKAFPTPISLTMRTDLFDFELPLGHIALRPANPRDGARMLIVQPDGVLGDGIVADLTHWLCAPHKLV